MSANQNSNEHDRMRELIGKIHDADVAYYQQDRPIMTDREYDQLVDELQALETETGLILSNSPTQHVGGEILDELIPVRHTKPMLSAGKTKQVEDGRADDRAPVRERRPAAGHYAWPGWYHRRRRDPYGPYLSECPAHHTHSGAIRGARRRRHLLGQFW